MGSHTGGLPGRPLFFFPFPSPGSSSSLTLRLRLTVSPCPDSLDESLHKINTHPKKLQTTSRTCTPSAAPALQISLLRCTYCKTGNSELIIVAVLWLKQVYGKQLIQSRSEAGTHCLLLQLSFSKIIQSEEWVKTSIHSHHINLHTQNNKAQAEAYMEKIYNF